MLIEMAIADGELSEQEKRVLFKNAQEEGIDLDEFEMVINAKLFEKQKEIKKENQPKQEAPTRPLQSNKIGGPVKKCPACGANYIPGTAVCPECGYIFSGITTTSSAEKLYNKLQEFNNQNRLKSEDSIVGSFLKMYNLSDSGASDIARRKMDVIQSFPVPNNREDLIDLLTSLEPKSNINGPKNGVSGGGIPGIGIQRDKKEDLSYAYWLLFSNCINKAKVSFAKDKDFAPFFEYYERTTASATGIFNRFKKK